MHCGCGHVFFVIVVDFFNCFISIKTFLRTKRYGRGKHEIYNSSSSEVEIAISVL